MGVPGACIACGPHGTWLGACDPCGKQPPTTLKLDSPDLIITKGLDRVLVHKRAMQPPSCRQAQTST